MTRIISLFFTLLLSSSAALAYSGSTGSFFSCTDLRGKFLLFATTSDNIGILPKNYPQVWQIFSRPGQLGMRSTPNSKQGAKELIYSYSDGSITKIATDCIEIEQNF